MSATHAATDPQVDRVSVEEGRCRVDVDCDGGLTVATLDSHLLAHDLGVLVAGHFGESVSSKSFQ